MQVSLRMCRLHQASTHPTSSTVYVTVTVVFFVFVTVVVELIVE